MKMNGLETEDGKRVAYFRAYINTNQCDLEFSLTIHNEIVGTVLLEVNAIRQIHDTVGSLLTHVQNKIKKILKDKVKDSGISFQIPVELKDNGVNVDNSISCKHVIELHSKALTFHIFEQTFNVYINAPLVQVIKLPGVIYANFTTQPTYCKTMYTKSELSEHRWFKSLDKENWTQVGTAFTYKTQLADIDHYLKFRFLPKNQHCEGPVFEVISNNVVEQLPDMPKSAFEDRHKYTYEKLNGKEFRIVSYNILSNRYIDIGNQFSHCPDQFLAIDYRKSLLVKEIAGYNGDVVCLQEMDNKEYIHYFRHKFKNMGYKSIFNKKGNRIPEGLCCAYNSSRFELLQSSHIVLSEDLKKNKNLQYIRDLYKGNETVQELLQKQATSLQLLVLQAKGMHKIVILGNTHLYYHSEANHIRLIQVAVAMYHLKKLKDQYNKMKKMKASIIFCGDFNSVPESDVFQYLTKGTVTNSQISAQDKEVTLSHPVKFKSACGVPKFTNYTSDFKGCLDYVFVEDEGLHVTYSVPFPEEAVLAENVALPSQVFPSDHLALIACLKWM